MHNTNFIAYTKNGVVCVPKSHSFNTFRNMDSNTYIKKLPLGVASVIGANNYIVLEQLIELHNGYVKYDHNVNKNNTTINFDGYIGISQKQLSMLCGMSDKAVAKCIDWLCKPYSIDDEEYKEPYITITKGKDRSKGRRNLYKVNPNVVSWLMEDMKSDLLEIPKGTKKKGKYERIEKQTYEDSLQSVYNENNNRLMYAENK